MNRSGAEYACVQGWGVFDGPVDEASILATGGDLGLANAIRSTGATNVLMLGGEEYPNDLSQWLAHEPTDPAGNLVASWHSYSFNTCATQSGWTSQVAPVIAKVPVIVGEMGESDPAGPAVAQRG
jgi:endoglucanase